MKKCISCGLEMKDDDIFCPACGAAQPAPEPGSAAVFTDTPTGQGAPAGNISNSYGVQQNAYGAQGGTGNPGGTWGGQPNYGVPQKPPGTTGMLVWSIILILFCLPLGIPALVFAAMSSSDNDYATAAHHVHLSKIFCIIGTVLTAVAIVAYVVFIVVFVYFAGSAASSDLFAALLF